MPFYLVSEKHQFQLKIGMNILGRQNGCDFQLYDKHISRQHLSLDLLADGTVTLLDLGSSNGLFIKGKKVASAILQNGDSFVLGAVKFRVLASDN